MAIQRGWPPCPHAALASQRKESGLHDFRLTQPCSEQSGDEPAQLSQRLQKQRSFPSGNCCSKNSQEASTLQRAVWEKWRMWSESEPGSKLASGHQGRASAVFPVLPTGFVQLNSTYPVECKTPKNRSLTERTRFRHNLARL